MTTPQLSGATAVFGIPYPLLTDRLTDGAAAMQALAETVDEQLGAVIPLRDQALAELAAASDAEEAAALAAITAARDAAVADVNSVSSSADAINARLDDLTTLLWIGAL